ncbi:MerR family transcriptional regulator [Cellulomonas soli]|uniref:MerR family transcriptional regulator n=1 Tax=Cellulomonas soli TaxID=931535 RepID=UPI003F85C58C
MPPDEDALLGEPSAPALTVAGVARRLGVAPATLRTWDRRYGLGPSAHAPGQHRRYTPQDVDRLLVMRRLTVDGVAPAEAARAALAAGSTGESPRPATVTPAHVVDAAVAGDVERCARLLALHDGADVGQWWTGLAEPSLHTLARLTVVDRPGVDAAATLTAAALAALRARTAVAPPPGTPVVLLLAPAGEPRPLSVHALAAALVAAGVDARIVGGPVGPHRVLELVLMSRPVAVVHLHEKAGAAPDALVGLVERLVHAHPDLPQFVVAPEGSTAHLPSGRSVHRARTFTGVLHEVAATAVSRDTIG